ncbi:MAG: 50S ribosomal protein L6 [Alphaproteobacteria bacterium]|nr:50S ribosomal protein L6 [Alphaproteobacteria bacterium]
MSRIGKNPVPVPQGVTVEVNGQDVAAKGKLGSLALRVHDDVSVTLEDGANGGKQVRLAPRSNSKLAKTLWPTSRTLVRNIVEGVSEGFSQTLEIQGVGYRANLQGQDLVLSLGYSHEVRYTVPQGIKVEVDKQTVIKISGIDKQLVGQVAAEIISWRPVEPYKGKGIRKEGQFVVRKEGKKK